MPSLVVLAAGMSSRFGRLKQIEAVGPAGESLLDYAVFDALRAGCSTVVFVIRPEMETSFREQIVGKWERHAAVHLAFQSLDLPDGNIVEPAIGRSKPWGTAHAVMAAAPCVGEPFVVVNADDYYGTSSFEHLYAHLASTANEQPSTFALIGYPLDDTLSPHGGVSRAVCEVDGSGLLVRVAEFRDALMRNGQIVGVGPTGEPASVRGDAPVSMNIWGFTPDVFRLLDAEFDRFVSERGDDPDSEFLLPAAVNTILAAGHARARVIPATDPWFGITHPGDLVNARAEIRRLIAQGRYPEPLLNE